MTTLVGRKAPDFTASAVLGSGEIVNSFKLSDRLKEKYGLLVFYPLDFTFVCPSELIALHHRFKQFKERRKKPLRRSERQGQTLGGPPSI